MVSAIGADLIVCMAAGYFLGKYISDLTGQRVWIAGGLIVGMAVGIVSIVFLIKRLLEEPND